MKKIISLICFLIPLLSLATEHDTLRFWIELKDKNNSPYSTENPRVYLSQKAIGRRQKFDIKITEEDFPVNPEYIQQIAGLGVKILNTSRWLNGISVETADSDKVFKIRALPFVKSIEKTGIHLNVDNSKMDYRMEYLMSFTGEEEDTTQSLVGGLTPHTKEYYGKAWNQTKMLDGQDLHSLGLTGKGITIAILDGGFMNVHKLTTFEHLFQNKQLLGTWDFVELDSDVYDDNNHGMNVLSCMAAKTPGKMVGTAPDANYWLLRTEDANSEYPIEETNWAAGAEFADSAGVDIINSSLGYTLYDDRMLSYDYSQLNGKISRASRAATIAAKKGILVCNAAGNEGDNDWQYIGAPADADGIITVGGVTADSLRSDFSSYGPTADGRLKPMLVAQATNTTVASVANSFYSSNGTSFATPVLAGMVACLVQAHPDKTVEEIIEALQLSGTQYFAPDTAIGYGIPNFKRALRYLGGDTYFNYKEDQVETRPAKTISSYSSIIIYSHKKQKLNLLLKNKTGFEMANYKEMEPGFHKIGFSVLDGLKPGTYNFEVWLSGKLKYTFEVVK